MTKEEREVMRMALEALNWTDEWRPQGLKQETLTALEKCLANDALEKKAENARELGLDYEPEQAQQAEPVAWRFTGIAGLKRFMTQKQYEAQTPETKKWYEPFRCANCITSPPRQWVGLTDWEINSIAQNNHPLYGIRTFARAIEAAVLEKQK
jgi:hypothetical protein